MNGFFGFLAILAAFIYVVGFFFGETVAEKKEKAQQETEQK